MNCVQWKSGLTVTARFLEGTSNHFILGFKTQQDQACFRLAPLSLLTEAIKFSLVFPSSYPTTTPLRSQNDHFFYFRENQNIQCLCLQAFCRVHPPMSVPHFQRKELWGPCSWLGLCSQGGACPTAGALLGLLSPLLCSISSPVACSYASNLPWIN